MKATILVLLLIPAALLAGDHNKKNAQSQPGATAAASHAPLTLPADAKRTEPNTYTWTDQRGKKWIYRQTPFGLVRLEDKLAQSAPQNTAAVEQITAVEDGDVVHFERPTPFGKQKWTKRKADLTADEMAALERQNQQRGETAVKTAGKEQ